MEWCITAPTQNVTQCTNWYSVKKLIKSVTSYKYTCEKRAMKFDVQMFDRKQIKERKKESVVPDGT